MNRFNNFPRLVIAWRDIILDLNSDGDDFEDTEFVKNYHLKLKIKLSQYCKSKF